MKNKIISIILIFILISLFFINKVFAVSSSYYGNPVTELPEGAFSEAIFNSDVYKSGNYYTFVAYTHSTSRWFAFAIPKTDTLKAYVDLEIGTLFFNETVSGITLFASSLYELPSTYGTWTDDEDYMLNIVYLDFNMDFYADFDIYTDNTYTELFYDSTYVNVIYPKIANSYEHLSTGTYDYVLVTPGTFSSSENIGLYIYDNVNVDDYDSIIEQKPKFTTILNSSSKYYKYVTVDNVTEFWYEIPRTSLGINFKNNVTYLYCLLLDGSPIQEIYSTVGGLTTEDIINNNSDDLNSSIKDLEAELNNSLDEQTDKLLESNNKTQEKLEEQTAAIEENNKTNKNIFERIGEMLSYINPFSENFFGKKLVDLIINGLKSLFIPGDDFFSSYFDELNNWFSDRLGFLYYPLELLFDLLDRFLNINFAEPVINIPNIKEPFTNVTLIKSISFNFNDLLENETLKNVHDIYFIIVDAFIYIGLVGLLYKKYEEVMTK